MPSIRLETVGGMGSDTKRWLRRGPTHGNNFLGAGVFEHQGRVIRREAKPEAIDARYSQSLEARHLLLFSAGDGETLHCLIPEDV